MTAPERPFDDKACTPYVCQWCGNPVPLMVNTDEPLLCPICEKRALKRKVKDKDGIARFVKPKPVAPSSESPVTQYVKDFEKATPVTQNSTPIPAKPPTKMDICPYCGKRMPCQGLYAHKAMHVRNGDHIKTYFIAESPKPEPGFIDTPKPPKTPASERERRDHNENYQRQ